MTSRASSSRRSARGGGDRDGDVEGSSQIPLRERHRADRVAQQHTAVTAIPSFEQPHPSRPAAGVLLGEGPHRDPAGSGAHRSHDLRDLHAVERLAQLPAWRSARAPLSNHQPTKLVKKPLSGSVPRISIRNPRAISPDPNQTPALVAIRVARQRSRVTAHATAWRTRPPSRGAAGKKVEHGQHDVDHRQPAEGGHGQVAAAAAHQQRPDQPQDPSEEGADQRPDAGDTELGSRRWASPSMRVTPPIQHRVMPSTCRPNRRATMAWPSSCSRTPNSSTTAVMRAGDGVGRAGVPGRLEGEPVVRPAPPATKATMTRRLQLSPTRTPASRPRRTVSLMPPGYACGPRKHGGPPCRRRGPRWRGACRSACGPRARARSTLARPSLK